MISNFVWLVCVLGAEFTQCRVPTADYYTIPCRAHAALGVKYRKLSWYKVIGSEYLGLVGKNLRANHTLLYGSANHSYEVGEEYSLLLPPSALGDCGTYHCTLWPPLGEYIQEGQYHYYPIGCVKPTEGFPIIPFTATPSSYCDGSKDLAAWGIPAALVIFIFIFITFGSVVSRRNRLKKYKLSDMAEG